MLAPYDLAPLARKTIAAYKSKGWKVAVAESCTGGMLAAALTSVPGASSVFERGFVTYCNDAKTDLLGVLPDTLSMHGPVSTQVADEMAEGALAYSQADAVVSVTGFAGPDGGTKEKPVGIIYFGIATREGARFHVEALFEGDRESIRLQATSQALTLLLSLTEE